MFGFLPFPLKQVPLYIFYPIILTNLLNSFFYYLLIFFLRFHCLRPYFFFTSCPTMNGFQHCAREIKNKTKKYYNYVIESEEGYKVRNYKVRNHQFVVCAKNKFYSLPLCQSNLSNIFSQIVTLEIKTLS